MLPSSSQLLHIDRQLHQWSFGIRLCSTNVSQIKRKYAWAAISGFLVGTLQDLSDSCALCGLRDSQTGWMHQNLYRPELARKRPDHIFYKVITGSSYAGNWPIIHWFGFFSAISFGFLLRPDLDFSPPSASAQHFRLKSITPWAHIVNWNRKYVVHLHLILAKKSFWEQSGSLHDNRHHFWPRVGLIFQASASLGQHCCHCFVASQKLISGFSLETDLWNTF